jgi:hypothetical protein
VEGRRRAFASLRSLGGRVDDSRRRRPARARERPRSAAPRALRISEECRVSEDGQLIRPLQGKATITAADKKLALGKFDDEKWKASFAYEQPADERLVLDGEMDAHRLRLELRLVDHTKFLLNSRGFHWVQEMPFNR